MLEEEQHNLFVKEAFRVLGKVKNNSWDFFFILFMLALKNIIEKSPLLKMALQMLSYYMTIDSSYRSQFHDMFVWAHVHISVYSALDFQQDCGNFLSFA